VSLVLDAGAFVAVERGDRHVVALIKLEGMAGRTPVTHGGVLGQVWRGGAGRQAPLARLLPGVKIEPLDAVMGRRAGVLLGNAGVSDVIDAAVVLLAEDGDSVLTSDAEDLAHLAAVATLDVEIVPV
jgi:hypothetical protein